MKWIEVEIKSVINEVDVFADVLLSLGSNGVSIHDPKELGEYIENSPIYEYTDDDLISSMGEKFIVKGYFKKTEDITTVLKTISQNINKLDIIKENEYEINTRIYDDNEWVGNLKKHFKSFDLTETIIVKPTWEKLNTDKKILEIDPGLAFGTGTHETTSLSAHLIEKYIKEGDAFLDVGCGTGILTMVAMLNEASQGKAIDIDPIACKTCKDLFIKNNIENYEIVCGEIKELNDQKYDMICANIIADVVIDIVLEIKKRLMPNGVAIISGVINERIREVEDCYLNNEFMLIEKTLENSWGTFAFKINS